MKRTLLLVLACLAFVYTNAQTGFSCDTPISISLPYYTSDSTGNYGDTYDTSQSVNCSFSTTNVNYFAGNDVFYSFTAQLDGMVNVTMKSMSFQSSLYVFEGCNFANCSGMASTPAYIRSLTISVSSGTTYTIALSSASTTNYDYTLAVQYTCAAPPSGLSSSSPLAGQSTLSWQATGATNYQVAVQPAGSGFPTDNGSYVVSTSNSATVNVPPGVPMQYWVRALCGPLAYSAWVGPFPFRTPLCNADQKCNYIFRKTDTGGNGWDGAEIEVRQNGVFFARNTLSSGTGPTDISVALCDGYPLTVTCVAAGTAPQECRLEIINPLGQTIYSSTAGEFSTGNILFTSLVDCDTPVCMGAPVNLTTTNVTSQTASLAWAPSGGSNWDVFVGPLADGPPNGASTPTAQNLSQTSFNIVGLEQGYSYRACVRSHCDQGLSGWSCTTLTAVPLCNQPLSLNTVEVTQTGAKLRWNKADAADNQWEILLIPGPSAPAPPTANPTQGTLYPVTTSSSTTLQSYLVGSLSPSTIYYYYVRTICANGYKSQWAGPHIFNTQICLTSNKCTYKFLMTDSGSNGWENGTIQVRQNGIVVGTLSLSSSNGSSSQQNIALCDDTPFDLYWSAAGDAPDEIGLTVISPYNDALYTKFAGVGSPLTTLYSGTAECTAPSCRKPTLVTCTTNSQTSISVSISGFGSSQWEIYLAAPGAPPPVNGSPVSNVAPHYITDSTVTVINGLTPSTLYAVYVRAICSDTDFSTWTLLNPAYARTRPINDNCINAIEVPVNTNVSCILTGTGNLLGGSIDSSVTYTGTPCSVNLADIWFKFTATSATHVLSYISSGDNNPTVSCSIFSGSCTTALTQLVCTSQPYSMVTGLIPGTVYYIRCASSSTSLNNIIQICIKTPTPVMNDECASAITLSMNANTDCEQSTSGSFIGATASSPASSCSDSIDDDVWFKFTAQDITHIISFSNLQNVGTGLAYAVYSGTCDNLILEYCASAGTYSKRYAGYVPGNTYYVRVWSAATTPSPITFDLCVSMEPTCDHARPFCGSTPEDPYVFRNVTGIASESGMGCLYTTPNAAYYYIKVGQAGKLKFTIQQNTSYDQSGNATGQPLDVDFVVWGPFDSAEACSQIEFSECTGCPSNSNSSFYPFGNIIDCSYQALAEENMTIDNASAGKYYLLVVTNFSDQNGYIKMFQTNYGQIGAGVLACIDKIQLVSFVDENDNGARDSSEAYFNHGWFKYQKNGLPAVTTVMPWRGKYDLFDNNPANFYDFDFEIDPLYAPYYALTTSSYSNVSVTGGAGTQTLYFPLTVVQSYADISVTLSAVNSARPGSVHNLKIKLKNNGLTPLHGTLEFYNDIALSPVLTDAMMSPTNYGWNMPVTAIAPGEERTIPAQLSVPLLPNVSLGQQLLNKVVFVPSGNDIVPINNLASVVSVVRSSYDPNDKMGHYGPLVDIDDFGNNGVLRYTIRFQNTGNAEAHVVRIEDLLDSQLDPSTVRMLDASHPYVLFRQGNQLTWQFDQINLPPQTDSEADSQGYVTFEIKPFGGYTVGDIIPNGANIYFDTNPAIVTNVFETLFTGTLGTTPVTQKMVRIYPNPADHTVTIDFAQTAVINTVRMFDMLGKEVVRYATEAQTRIDLDVSRLQAGFYLIEIFTTDGTRLMRKLSVK